MSLRLSYSRGIVFRFPSYAFIVDPSSSRFPPSCSSSFVTHSHLDHSAVFPSSLLTYSTRVSAALFSAFTGRSPTNLRFSEFFHSFNFFDDLSVEFLPAGHLLGAAQFLFYFPDEVLLYTGDISLSSMSTVPSASIPDVQIDTLIIESTYGNPHFYFDSPDRIKLNILQWIVSTLQRGRVPIVNIGPSGPAQEIISFLNTMLSVDIYVDEKVSAINEIYLQEGIKLYWRSFSDLSDFDPHSSVVFLPRNQLKVPNFFHSFPFSRAIITGQAVRFSYSRFNQAFPFSMHANYFELINFVKAVNPKRVFTIYGFDVEFARSINKELGIIAKPLRYANKKLTLDDFL